MALIIEDGSMPEGANTFAGVADTDAYFSVRGNDSWPASTGTDEDANLTAKESALVRAADYLNTLYWKGRKVQWDWPMCWPRQGVGIPGGDEDDLIPDNVVPMQVKRACMELAAIIYSGADLFESVERGGGIKSETVGPISTTYFDDASGETYYPAVAGLIEGLVSVVPGSGGPSLSMHKVVPV